MSEPRRQFSLEFKREAMQLIVQQGLSVAEAARRLDVRESLLRRWRKGQITMASDTNDPNGKRRVTFKGLDGKRRTIRLGQCSERIANDVRRHVEAILSAAAADSAIDQRTADWLGKVSDDLHSKLVAVGLVNPRNSAPADVTTFGRCVDQHRESRSHLKGGHADGDRLRIEQRG